MTKKIYFIIISILIFTNTNAQLGNLKATLFMNSTNTLTIQVYFDNYVPINVTSGPELNVTGNQIFGTDVWSGTDLIYREYTFSILPNNLYTTTTSSWDNATNAYSNTYSAKLYTDNNNNIKYGNYQNLNATTFHTAFGAYEVRNEHTITNPTMTSGVYSGTINQVGDLTDVNKTLMLNTGIVQIECTDASIYTATTSAYNNTLNTINFSANIPSGKTVARVLASHAWIDVPDVLSVFALPIDIISFEGKSVENEYHLALEVAKEWNVKQLELEKSIDGKNYESIETLLPVNSLIYNFIDRNPSQINFYRIKVVDIDEHIMYSKVINYSKTNIDIVKLYPNPTTNILTIELPQRKTNQTIYIKNLFGQIVYKQEILDKQFETINTESLSKGNYILQVVSTSQTLTTKFSKE